MTSWLTPLIILIVLLLLGAWSIWLERRVLALWQVTKNIQPSLNNLEEECND
ncbi:hypothetical protein [Colwellia sp. MT41]|uniref:hypothetical protein n=1 Tax=Colwellia sp. MT41 TaxID=58049 RepID=UPI000B12081F|nr:hypothetical protein [Colwellia sp. MT41]